MNLFFHGNKLAQQGEPGKSAYDYAVDGGYTGTEAEFQALMGSGPWIPGTAEDLSGKLNAKKAQIFDMTDPLTWKKVGQISIGANFTIYALLTNVGFANPVRPNIAWLILGGKIFDSSQYIYGKLLYLYGYGLQSDYGRIVVTADGGIFARGGNYSTINYNAVRITNLSIFSEPEPVNAEPENIVWDSLQNSDYVVTASQMAASIKEGMSE